MSYILVAVLFFLFVFLIKSNIRPSFLFFFALSLIYFAGGIRTTEFLSSFVNPSILAVVLLVPIAFVLEKTSHVQNLYQFLYAQDSVRWILLKMGIVVSALSAFVSNTAVVMTLLGGVDRKKSDLPVQKLYMPLSFFAVLGGTLTLIGTSTNLLINGLLFEMDLAPLAFFDFFYVGIFLVLFGLIYLVLFAPKLLRGKPEADVQGEDYFLEAQVQVGSSLVGRTVLDNGLRNLEGLFLAEIIRGDDILSPVRPVEKIRENDILVFAGDIAHVQVLDQFPGLKIFEEDQDRLLSNLKEVVVSQNSSLVGLRIKEANFRSEFNAAVVAVRRGAEKLSGKIGLIRIEPGDTLVLTTGKDFFKRRNLHQHFYYVQDLQIFERLGKTHSWFAIGLFAIAIVLSAFGVLELFQALLGVFLIYFLIGYTDAKDIKGAYLTDLFILIGSATGLAKVLFVSGLAEQSALVMLSYFSGDNPFVAMSGVFFVTVIFTQLVTNVAAATLVLPLAISLASTLEVSYIPFVMAVAYGASASFLTPHSYQTNLIVYAAGGYRLKDFLRVGIPMLVIYSILTLLLIPLFFKF